MNSFLRQSWAPHLGSVPALQAETIPDTRLVLWADRPQAVDEAVTVFLHRLSATLAHSSPAIAGASVTSNTLDRDLMDGTFLISG